MALKYVKLLILRYNMLFCWFLNLKVHLYLFACISHRLSKCHVNLSDSSPPLHWNSCFYLGPKSNQPDDYWMRCFQQIHTPISILHLRNYSHYLLLSLKDSFRPLVLCNTHFLHLQKIIRHLWGDVVRYKTF